jgi:hypothetical protein
MEALKKSLRDAGVSSVSPGTGPTPPEAAKWLDASRDWTEDFSHENGDYLNTCRTCRTEFRGHKRRMTCKRCSTPSSTGTPLEPASKSVHWLDATSEMKLSIIEQYSEKLDDLGMRIHSGPADWVDMEDDALLVEQVGGLLGMLAIDVARRAPAGDTERALRELREKVDEALRDMPSFSPNTYGTSLIRRDEARALIASLRSAAPEDAVEELLKKAERQARYTESDCIGLVGIAALLRRLASTIRSLRQERDEAVVRAESIGKDRAEAWESADALCDHYYRMLGERDAAHTALRELREKVEALANEALAAMDDARSRSRTVAEQQAKRAIAFSDVVRLIDASLRSAAPEGTTEATDG